MVRTISSAGQDKRRDSAKPTLLLFDKGDASAPEEHSPGR
jgi:hypothetical protein